MIYKEIALDQLSEGKGLLRTGVMKERLEELVQSIRRIGVIEPLIVQEIEGEKHEVIAGWRRYTAAGMAGLVSVPCLVVGEKADVEAIRSHENFFREDVNDVDQGRYFVYLRDGRGMVLAEIAKMVGKSLSYVFQRVGLVGGDEAVLAALEAFQITFSVARTLLGVKGVQLRRRLLKMAVDEGASPSVVVGWRKSLEKVPEVVVGPRREITGIPKLGQGDILREGCFLCEGLVEMDTLVPVHICPTCFDAVNLANEKRREVSKNG